MAPRYKYKVEIISGQYLDGEFTESVTNDAYTVAASESQAINNVKHRSGIKEKEYPIDGFGNFGYIRMKAQKEEQHDSI